MEWRKFSFFEFLLDFLILCIFIILNFFPKRDILPLAQYAGGCKFFQIAELGFPFTMYEEAEPLKSDVFKEHLAFFRHGETFSRYPDIKSEFKKYYFRPPSFRGGWILSKLALNLFSFLMVPVFIKTILFYMKSK